MRCTFLYLAVPVLSVAFVASGTIMRAQTPRSLVSGTRVRITAPGTLTPERQTGRVLALRPDTLLLQPDGGAASLALPLTAVTDIEASHGRHRSTGVGILIGLLAGGATGAVVGAATYQKPPGGCDLVSAQPKSCSAFDLGRGFQTGVLGVLGGVARRGGGRLRWSRAPE